MDEEDIEAERDAADALATGEYPPRATDSDEDQDGDDDDRYEQRERYDRARMSGPGVTSIGAGCTPIWRGASRP
ncbi:hypothetical protein ABZX98_32220 [Streptomyces sp. NPDC002992]|uniref:hypothetical protein n=1 Tax=Streptomyces sp. NPDC002992 TaxID=3154273 RepID=UPI0033BEC438